MTLRPATLCLMLLLCGCARGVAESGSLTDPVGGGDGGDLDSGASGGDAMTAPVLDAGAKDAGLATKDAGLSGSDAGSDASVATCPTVNQCSSARGVQPIAGDLGNDIRMTSGIGSEWLSVHVVDTEAEYNATSTLKARFSLTSEEGANYDLFVHKPASTGGKATPPTDCSATPMASTNATGVDTVQLSWDDDQNFLGQSAGDGLIISIEVRHVSGPCGSWNLTVEGNYK